MTTRKGKLERESQKDGETRSPDTPSAKKPRAKQSTTKNARVTKPATSTPGVEKPSTTKPTAKRDIANPAGPASSAVPAVPFDRRLMEQQLAAIQRLLKEHDFATVEEANAFLQELTTSGQPLQMSPTTPMTPLEEAQELVYQALQAEGDARLALARRALEISPECADAYVLLAETSETPEEARRYYEQGVAAGERALGPELFVEDVGEFWGLLETRPYMRARQGLAEVLWHLGEREAAVEHARELLRLNPGDNQGIRYMLASWLIMVGDDMALEQLLAQFPDEWSASWAYTRALHTFRTQGAGAEAEKAFEEAMEVNPFVPMYLLSVLPFPDEQPEYYGMGDKNEAVVYLFESAEAWATTPGAFEWVVDIVVRVMGPKVFGGGNRRSSTKQVSTKPRSSGKRSSTGRKPHGPKHN